MSAAEVSRVFGAIVGASEMLEILDGEWVRVTIAIPSEKEEAA